MRRTIAVATAALLAACGLAHEAAADTIVDTLGNPSPGFADGEFVTIFQLAAAQGGQPAPFDGPIGNDLGLDPAFFDASWAHSYGAVDPLTMAITAATLTIGIADHDSAASGDQLRLLTVDGVDLTAVLSPLMEAPGQGQQEFGVGGEYNVYTIDLLAGGVTAASLAGGTASIHLALQGPGLVDDLLGGTVVESAGNAAYLLFSSLTLRTSAAVPEPGTAALCGLAILGGLALRLRR